MGYWEEKEQAIRVLEETLQICERNDRLIQAIMCTRRHTMLYREPEEWFHKYVGKNKIPLYKEQHGKIRVRCCRPLTAVQEVGKRYPGCRIGVVNYASPVTAGGGVIRGALSQEESMCRSTTLYPCLHTLELQEQFYDKNRECGTFCYTDACIYTPGIIGICRDGVLPERLQEKDWYVMDVISCAAPNIRMDSVSGDNSRHNLQSILDKRIRGIIQVALCNRIEVLILGVFGCGIYGNSPEMVVSAFKKALKEYQYSFRAIEFAIYDTEDTAIYDIFFAGFNP